MAKLHRTCSWNSKSKGYRLAIANKEVTWLAAWYLTPYLIIIIIMESRGLLMLEQLGFSSSVFGYFPCSDWVCDWFGHEIAYQHKSSWWLYHECLLYHERIDAPHCLYGCRHYIWLSTSFLRFLKSLVGVSWVSLVCWVSFESIVYC